MKSTDSIAGAGDTPEQPDGRQPAPDAAEAERIEEKIDRDLADSFPASDPPGWTMGIGEREPVSE